MTLRKVVVALFLLLACGCSETSLHKLEDPPEPPLPPNPQLEVYSDNDVDPHKIVYGDINVGNSEVRKVILDSVGDDTVHIHDIYIDGYATFETDNLSSLDPLMEPGSSWVLEISYQPLHDESALGELVVISNDVEDPEVRVRLMAEGLGPKIEVFPPSFDFGNFEIGCYNDVDVFVGNTGRGILEIYDVYIDDMSSLSGEMYLMNNSLPGGFILPGESAVVQMLYEPEDVIPDSCSLHVENNDLSRPDATVFATGTAHYEAIITDQFLQEGNNQTDILWVVDNSCSMYQEQNTLATNFSSFVSIIEAQNVDYQIGVVSTDVGDNGELQGLVPIITSSTPNPAQEFTANVNLGTYGSGWEKGMDSAWLALQPNILGPGGFNEGFLRPLAGLRIIFVSDENDGSNLFPSVPDYVTFFQSLKSDPALVVTSDITGGPTGCQGPGGYAYVGTDYIAATNLTGGISASICDANWSGIMNNLGWMSVSLADSFELSESNIVVDTIVVYLDGIVVNVGWQYDSVNNAVVFDFDHVPPDQTQVDIEYAVYGDCFD